MLDRLIRGRAWIAIVAAGLMGLVFLQVSLLKLNTGISHAVTTAQTLERQNSKLRGDVSRLGDGQRIEDAAAAAGMVLPAAGQYRYLDASKADPRRAAGAITAPDPVEQLPATAATATGASATGAAGAASGTAGGTTATAPTATTATTPTAPATTASATAPSGSTPTAPATAPTTAAPTTAAPATTPATTAAPATTTQQQQPTSTGGTPGAAATTTGQP